MASFNGNTDDSENKPPHNVEDEDMDQCSELLMWISNKLYYKSHPWIFWTGFILVCWGVSEIIRTVLPGLIKLIIDLIQDFGILIWMKLRNVFLSPRRRRRKTGGKKKSRRGGWWSFKRKKSRKSSSSRYDDESSESEEDSGEEEGSGEDDDDDDE